MSAVTYKNHVGEIESDVTSHPNQVRKLDVQRPWRTLLGSALLTKFRNLLGRTLNSAELPQSMRLLIVVRKQKMIPRCSTMDY